MPAKNIYPCSPPLERGKPAVLKVDPKRKSIIYAYDRTVVIKNVDNPLDTQIYTGHGYPVTSYAMAPSGCYMATGDSSGCLRIWACDTPEQILKGEYPMLAGAISDIDWNSENNRIVVVGEGNPPAKVIMWDSGNSVGEITGHIKKITTVSYKPSRPFRICTGSDDLKVNFYEGPPFKFKGTAKTHERFVNCVRYSPDGARFFSVSSDMFLAIFEAKESKLEAEKKVTTGAIYNACWSPDSSKVLCVSADKTVKIIDASTLDEVGSFSFGKGVGDQQVGCAWLADKVISYSLGGAMSMLDPANLSAPTSVEFGHNKPVNCLTFTDGKLFSGSFADPTGTLVGVTLGWDLAKGVAEAFAGDPPANRVSSLGVGGEGLVVLSNDNVVTYCTTSPPAYGDKVQLESQPISMGCAGSTVAVICHDESLVIISKKAITKSCKVSDTLPASVAVAPNEAMIAVGGSGEPASIVVVDAAGGQKFKLDRHKNSVTALAFAGDSALLASGCANKEVVVWSTVDGSPVYTGMSGYHSARITCMAWSKAGVLASGGVDSTLIVWDLEAKKPKSKSPLCHASGGINDLCFVDDNTVATCGSDACIKTWSI